MAERAQELAGAVPGWPEPAPVLDPGELPEDDDPDDDAGAAGVAVPGSAELSVADGREEPVPVVVEDPFAPLTTGSLPATDVESTTGLPVPVDVVVLGVPEAGG
jgi:hypothetical protein